MDEESLFPKIQRSIENLIEDEEGNIPAGKLLMIGTMIVLLSNMLSIEGFAKHGSHSSHSSHESHSSTSYIRGHTNHGSHYDHGSHESHGSHTSHSNTSSHSNSNYSAAGDYSTPKAPLANGIIGVTGNLIDNSSLQIKLPTIDPEVAIPEDTPSVGIIPAIAMPLDTPKTDVPIPEVKKAPPTPEVFPESDQ